MLRCDVPPHMLCLGKRCSTVFTDEGSLAQMNLVHMLLEMTTLLEELSTGVALKRLQLKMNRIHMTLETPSLREVFSTGVALERLLLEMDNLVMALNVSR